MEGFSASAVLAVLFGLFLLPVLFVPYVAWTYRRRGTFSWGHAVLDVAALIYLMALWTYTILPVPDAATMDCSDGGAGAQLLPFANLAEVDLALNGLTDPALLQLIANVVLFLPFGMLARYLVAPKRPGRVVLAGLGVSLLIELTQLTGIWGIYPCPYRVFDVDDLITNTLGAAIGVFLAPLLRFVPGQQVVPQDRPRIVTRGRRLLGMAVDFASVQLLSLGLYIVVAVALREAGFGDGQELYETLQGWITLTVSLLLLLALPLFGRGATLGQRATFVCPVDATGGRPRLLSRLIRWATGSGGYFVLSAVASLTGVSALQNLATLWLVASAAVVIIRDPRGISGYASGLDVTDSRDASPLRSSAQEVDPRSMGMAVVAVVTCLYLGFSLLTILADLAPVVGTGFGALGVAALLLAGVAVVPYLVGAGIIAVRREGLSRLTVLPLLVAAAVVCPVVLLGVGVWTGSSVLTLAMLVVLAVTGYVGFLFVAFLAYGQWYARRDPVITPDAVVVLGSRVFGERVPPLLAARIDRGLEVLEAELDARPDSPVVLVCSGGQGSDEIMPEGEAMARYAADHGAAPERLLRETASRNTHENLTLTRQLLEERGLGTAMIAVTNDFHAFRAAMLAREAGISAQVVGAPTAKYYFPAAVIREFVGVVSLSPVLHALIALALAAGVGGLGALIMFGG